MANLYDSLNSMDAAFQAATVTDHSKLPDGTYTAVIDKAEIREPQKEGQSLRLSVTWLVSEGEYAGRLIFDGQPIAPDSRSLEFLKSYLHSINADVPTLSALPEKCNTLPGTSCQLALAARKTDPRYQNVYVRRYLGRVDANELRARLKSGTPAPAASGYEVVSTDEDLPF